MPKVPRYGGTSMKTRSYKPKASSTNLVTVPTKKAKSKAKQNVKTVPSKSFTTALHKAMPTKELRSYIDTSMSLLNLANFCRHTLVSNIAQGTQVNERLGCKVHASYLHLKGSFSNQQNTASLYIRLMVIQDRSPIAGSLNTTTFANLYNDYAWTDRAPTNNDDSSRYTINKRFYKTFYDKRIKLDPQGDGGSTNIYKKIKLNQKLYYHPADGTTSVPDNGRIYVIYHLYDSANTADTTRSVNISVMSRLFFRDA